MGRRNWSLDYGRQDLRKATKFTEGDYTGINPRQFYRTLKRSLEEIQEGNDFKYRTIGGQDSDLEIESEEVGQKTGTVTGRLAAISDWREIDSGTLQYRPYGPHGAAGIVIGLLLVLLGLSEPSIGIVGVLLTIGSGYLYFQTEEGEFPVHRQDAIRVLKSGEVSERTIESDSETRTDIFANMSVIYAGDTFVNVYSDGFDELDWTLRSAITNQVKKWNNRIVDQPVQKEEVSEGFSGHLMSWSNKDLESDQNTVHGIQSELNSDFGKRLEYTSVLLDQLPRETKDELEDHQNTLLDELQDLAEDMDVYVEREGLKQTTSV